MCHFTTDVIQLILLSSRWSVARIFSTRRSNVSLQLSSRSYHGTSVSCWSITADRCVLVPKTPPLPTVQAPEPRQPHTRHLLDPVRFSTSHRLDHSILTRHLTRQKEWRSQKSRWISIVTSCPIGSSDRALAMIEDERKVGTLVSLPMMRPRVLYCDLHPQDRKNSPDLSRILQPAR